MSPARTSSRTVVETARSSSDAPQLLHRGGDPAARLLLLAGRPARRSSSERSSAKMRASLLTVVRRRASVGCAVMTSCTSAPASVSCSSLGARPAGREARDRVAQRAAARRGRLGELADAQAPHAVVVLGEVHELVPAGEHPDEQLEVVRRRGRRRARRARRPRRRRRRASAARARPRGGAARAPAALDRRADDLARARR